MIRIIPETPAVLAGGNPFGFKTHFDIHESKHLEHRSSFDKLNQDQLVSQIKNQLEQLGVQPCEVAVTVGVQNGQGVFDGEMKTYEGRAQRVAQQVTDTVTRLVGSFTAQFPRSTFTLKMTQTVQITKVHPGGNPKLN